MIIIRKNKIINRYIISYLSIVAILAVIMIMFYTTNYSTSKDVKYAYISSSLENGMQEVEDLVIQLVTLSNHLDSNLDVILLGLSELENNNQNYALISNIQTIFLTSTAVTDVVDFFIFVLPNGIVMSSDGRVHPSIESFYGDFFTYSDYSMQEWVDELQENHAFWSNKEAFTGYNTGNYVAYSSVSSISDGQYLSALISENSWKNLFLPYEDSDTLMLRVIDGEGDVLFDNSDDETRIEETISVKSNIVNLTFEVLVPENFYAEGIYGEDIFILVLLALGLLSCVILSIYYSNRYGSPLLKLSNALEDRGVAAGNEGLIDTTLSLIENLDIEAEKKLEDFNQLKSTLTGLEFEYLISGNRTNYVPKGIETEEYQKEQLLLLFKMEYKTDTIEQLCERIQDKLIGQRLYQLSNESMATLFVYSEDYKEEIVTFVKNINIALFPQKLICAVSEPFNKMSAIRLAYVQANFALQYNKNNVCATTFFSQEQVSFKRPVIAISYYNSLDATLSISDIEKFNSFYDDFEKHMSSQSYTQNDLNQVAYILRSILINHVKKSSHLAAQVLYLTEYVQNNQHQLLLIKTKEICMQIFEENNQTKKSHNDVLKNELKLCIDTQYSNQNLSLTYLSEYLQVSTKYLSCFIQEQFGKSYTEYLQEVRMNEAQHLLKTTKLSVTEIAQRTGYYSTNTFYKSFKRFFNMSPSNYKELIQDEKDV